MDAEIARRKGAAGAEGGTDTAQSLAGMYGVAKKGKAAEDLSKTEAVSNVGFMRYIFDRQYSRERISLAEVFLNPLHQYSTPRPGRMTRRVSLATD